MANVETGVLEEIRAAVSETRDTANDTKEAVIRLEERFKAHADSRAMHTEPPCEYVKSIVGKFWIFIGVVGTAFVSLWFGKK